MLGCDWMRALVTGASSGIGREMARILADSYDELILVGRDEKRLKELDKELGSKTKIQLVIMDLSDKDHCIKLHNKYKDVDLLINNAGFGDYGYFDKTNVDKDILMIETNVMALHILTKLYLSDMKKKDSGHILNVASIAGFMPGPLMTTYYATKNYVVRLSEGIREELRRDKSHVKISILCPGPVATNFEKTANVEFQFPGVNSTDIAKYALGHLNRFYIVPGFGVKLSRIFLQMLPGSLTARIMYRLQSSRKEGEK